MGRSAASKVPKHVGRSATFALLVTLIAGSCSAAPPAPSFKGPLITSAGGVSGQYSAIPGAAYYSVGLIQLVNRSIEPVTITGIAEWQPNHLHLGEAYVARAAKRPDGSGAGALGVTSVRNFDKGQPNSLWANAQPLLGSRIGPNWGNKYFLGLGFKATGPGPTGDIRGIILTYRTDNGTTYRVRVPIAISMCTEQEDDSSCQNLDRRMNRRNAVDARLGNPPQSELDKAGTWHDD